eukprot:jgi/Mesvir1/15317/Mv06523-RA.1
MVHGFPSRALQARLEKARAEQARAGTAGQRTGWHAPSVQYAGVGSKYGASKRYLRQHAAAASKACPEPGDCAEQWTCAPECQIALRDSRPACKPSGQAHLTKPFSATIETKALNNRVLCFSAVAFGNMDVVNNVAGNVASTQHYCDWALLSYSGQASAWSHHLDSLEASYPGIRHRVRILADLQRPDILPSPGCGLPWSSHDKQLGWRQLATQHASVLSQYALIHLLDDDMFLPSFDYESFMTDLLCGLPQGTPMVAQPIYQGITDEFGYLTDEFWLAQPHVPVVVETNHVEIGAPLLYMGFFFWLMSHVYLHQLHLHWDVDWGQDLVWCNAAHHYMHTVLLFELGVNHTDERDLVACAVYPRTPLTSRDFNTLGDTAKDGFDIRGKVTLAAYEMVYPFWFVHLYKTGVLRMFNESTYGGEDGGGASTCRWREILESERMLIFEDDEDPGEVEVPGQGAGHVQSAGDRDPGALPGQGSVAPAQVPLVPAKDVAADQESGWPNQGGAVLG